MRDGEMPCATRCVVFPVSLVKIKRSDGTILFVNLNALSVAVFFCRKRRIILRRLR